MEAKYEARKQELLDECTVAPQIFEQVLPRLERFMKPFVENLVRKEQCEHANTFVQGLLSNLDHKNVESIAYRFGQQRMPLQWFCRHVGLGSRATARRVGSPSGRAVG